MALCRTDPPDTTWSNMAIPIFSPISDGEIAPGQDPTASVFVRLRDNPLAILGVDTADPAPVVNPPSQLVYADSLSDNNELAWPTTTAPDDRYSAWIEIANGASVGCLEFIAFSFSVGMQRSSGGTRATLSLSWADLDAAFTPNNNANKFYRTAMSAVYSGESFAGVRLANLNETTYENNNFPIDNTPVFGGLLHTGSGFDLAPNATAMLLQIDASNTGYGIASLYIEHRTAGNSQQIRFHGVTTGAFTAAAAAAARSFTRFVYSANG